MNENIVPRALPALTHEKFEALRRADASGELYRAIVSLALVDADRDYVETACVELSTHHDELVRGNAILGLGHLARRFGELSTECLAIIERGLLDPSRHVRGQAHAAAEDVVTLLGWFVAGIEQVGDIRLPDEE